jgi:mRNA interferase MazF
VPIPAGLPVRGVILADQVRSLDWRARDAQRIAPLPSTALAEVLARSLALLS